jgi:hypothetical protein
MEEVLSNNKLIGEEYIGFY